MPLWIRAARQRGAIDDVRTRRFAPAGPAPTDRLFDMICRTSCEGRSDDDVDDDEAGEAIDDAAAGSQHCSPSEHGFFYPIQASTIAQESTRSRGSSTACRSSSRVGIIAVTVWFVIKYRASVHPVPHPPGHNNVLEVVWTAIPAMIVFICFFWGFRVYMKMTVAAARLRPDRGHRQAVVWQFQYDNPKGGTKVQGEELWLVKDVPVEITLRSNDVIHACTSRRCG